METCFGGIFFLTKSQGVYGASKAGLISLHESLTSEIRHTYATSQAPSMIKTLLVCPGQIETNMFKGVKTPSSIFAPVLDPNVLARKIVEMLSEGKGGTLYMPFYTNFIPLFRAMPSRFTSLARRVSGMDVALTGLEGPGPSRFSTVVVHDAGGTDMAPNDDLDLITMESGGNSEIVMESEGTKGAKSAKASDVDQVLDTV